MSKKTPSKYDAIKHCAETLRPSFGDPGTRRTSNQREVGMKHEGLDTGTSTGPRTPRGKARSSQNAAKHWVESRRILPEEREEAAFLRTGFEEDFKPEGLSEQEVVDDLVLNRLHKRRIDKAMTRESSKATIEKTIELMENSERPIDQYWLRLANVLRGNSAEPAERLHPDVCVSVLQGLMKQIGERGPKPEDFALLRAIYGDQPTAPAGMSMSIMADLQDLQTEKGEAVATTRRRDFQKLILNTLQVEIEKQKAHQMLASDLLEVEFPRDFQEPPRDVLETLQRYRTANLKEFNSLLDSLERIRRLRRSAA